MKDQEIRAAALIILSSMILTACDISPSQKVTEVEALELLNSGKVTKERLKNLSLSA
jgi:hypothetical protein